MFTVPALAISLLLTPVAADECKPERDSPDVQVTAERGEPNFSYDQTTANLTEKSTGSYKPQGVGGPYWHTTGLTQTNINIHQHTTSHSLMMSDHSLSCVFIDRIQVDVILAPIVWVAHEFPEGSCMYNAVRDHEMKHVEVNRRVTNRHLEKIRAALVAVSNGRAFFGPTPPAQTQASVDQFMAQVKSELNAQAEDFYADESRSQREVDTMQEYQRISHLCPGAVNVQ